MFGWPDEEDVVCDVEDVSEVDVAVVCVVKVVLDESDSVVVDVSEELDVVAVVELVVDDDTVVVLV